MKKHGRRKIEVEEANAGFQIAPMIDVVFVIMLFFMVMAGAVKVERELKITLPSSPLLDQVKNLKFPDEIIVSVEETGSVTLNDEELDASTNKTLPNFTSSLMRLQQAAESRGDKVLVTIQAEERASYERVIDVLNSLAKARIANVTFSVGNYDN